MTAIQVTEWKRRKRAEGYCAEFCGDVAELGYSRCEKCRQKHNARALKKYRRLGKRVRGPYEPKARWTAKGKENLRVWQMLNLAERSRP